ncbi:MAG: PHP domain-containing protein [Gammaproteobacteria bacterium]
MSAKFIHLHLHTEYSIVDSVIRIESLMQWVAELGMPAVAVTDQSALFSMVKFYRAPKARGSSISSARTSGLMTWIKRCGWSCFVSVIRDGRRYREGQTNR